MSKSQAHKSIRGGRPHMNRNLKARIQESLASVLPITAIVIALHFTLTPMPPGTLALFLAGAFFLILGMGLFTLGADLSMMPMGEAVGSELTKSRKPLLLVAMAFVMGVFITIAEPDLQVLAEQVPSVPNMTLILFVAAGVGIFLVLALLRILLQVRLSYLLISAYLAVFALAVFASESFLPVAFDSGGVTTGPVTVPFILALGIGVAAVRGGRSSQDDSFGLVAVCSAGPILAVLLLDLFFKPSGLDFAQSGGADVRGLRDLFAAFGGALPFYFKEVGIAIAPIAGFFAVFQIFFLKLPKSQIIKMIVGLGYTYIGLVLFLTGVNTGFLPIGNFIGARIGALSQPWVLIPLGAVMGFFVVMAEPAVHVLNKQVEEITVGAITRRSMLLSLSVGVAVSICLSMARMLLGLSIWWFIVPGYVLALALTFFVPKVFTAIAFDSGGVASGPMTAAFLLPFAMGACASLGGNIMTDAFGLVALVAMTPLVTIQALGLVYNIRLKRQTAEPAPAQAMEESDEEIIDLE